MTKEENVEYCKKNGEFKIGTCDGLYDEIDTESWVAWCENGYYFYKKPGQKSPIKWVYVDTEFVRKWGEEYIPTPIDMSVVI